MDKKAKLLKAKSQLLRMPNSIQKVEMLRSYFSLLGYYQIIENKEMIDDDIDIDDEFTKKYERYVAKDTKKGIDKFYLNANKLYKKYDEIIKYYCENEFCHYDYINYVKVDKYKMQMYLWDFFSAIGEDVLQIYVKMVKEQNIFLNNSFMDRLGYAMDASPIDNPCITIKNIPDYLDFYITLAHEVGHCYQFNLQKNQLNCAMFDPYCEITSILFERLFIEYLRNNYVIKDTVKIDLENHLSFINCISISKLLCKLFIENKICVINPYNLSYATSLSEAEVIKEITDNCGYVKPFNLTPELTEIHYSFGDIISRYFLERLKNDFDTEWNNFKNFICTVNYLPMDEVIDTYFDINLIKDDIKKLTKSYR